MLALYTRRIRLSFQVVSIVAVALTLTVPVRADDDARTRAGRAFDDGVSLYQRASYAEAARAFLRADAIAPSSDAVANGLSAARRSNDYLLVVVAAERALTREAQDPKLAIAARQALADAAEHLAKVEIDCEPKPCDLNVDAKPIESGMRYVLPGTHVISAKNGAASAEQSMSFVAGATYQVMLHPVRPGESVRPAEVTSSGQPKATPSDKPKAKPNDGSGPAKDRTERPLSPAVFYAGVGVGVVLAGITTWSGFDTLSAKNDLPSQPTTREVDSVESKVHRTDIFLAATVVVAAATTYAGFALVDFGGSREHASVRLSPRAISIEGRF